jgi:hypothetical protein
MDTTNIFKSATIDYHGLGVSGLVCHKLAVESGDARKKFVVLDHPTRKVKISVNKSNQEE